MSNTLAAALRDHAAALRHLVQTQPMHDDNAQALYATGWVLDGAANVLDQLRGDLEGLDIRPCMGDVNRRQVETMLGRLRVVEHA